MEIETKCKGCVFLNENKQRYEMCDLGRLKNFVDNGATIENEDFIPIIKNRFCSAKRPSQWAEGKNKINLPLIVRAELLVNYEVIIPISQVDKPSLEITLNSLNKQLVKPSLIVLNCNSDNINYPNLIRLMKNQKLPFRVDRILPDSDGSRYEYLDALDISFDKVKTDYYLTLESGTDLNEEYVADIDEAINVEMKRFLILTNNESTSIGNFVNFQLHKKLEGNYPVRAKKIDEDCQDNNLILNTLIDKVKYLANKNSHHYLIKDYTDISNG